MNDIVQPGGALSVRVSNPPMPVHTAPAPSRASTSTSQPVTSPGRRPRLASEAVVVTLVALSVYLIAAWFLDFKYLVFPGDAMARMANGFYVLYSGDRHLSAVGFVWPPLTSASDLFFLLFKGLWPALATHDVAGSLTSAGAMAGAVFQLRALLAEWKVARAPRLVLVALFALNPMIIYYAANGLSEAFYLFTMVAATRYLVRWSRDTSSVTSLVYAGSMVGLGILGRNEGIGAALLGSVFVPSFSFVRGKGIFRNKARMAATDAVIFIMPFVTAFGAWVIAGYVITHQFLGQFTVNEVQISIQGVDRASTLSSRLSHEVHALLYIAPLVPVALILALIVAFKRRDSQLWPVACILGGALGFSLLSFAAGSVFPWFRFYIVSIPIEVILIGYVFSVPIWGTLYATQNLRRRSGIWSAIAVVIALVVIGPSLPTVEMGMFNPVIGPEETQYAAFIVHRHLTPTDISAKNHYEHVLSISQYIDNMHLSDGSVVTDDSVVCVPEVIVTSSNARVFVIPNDRNFRPVLADPITFHAHYLLVPWSVGLSAVNAINQQYPGIYDGRPSSFVTIVHSFPAGDICPAFRLLRVNGHPAVG
jgi:lipoprotein signal peptidase